MAVLLLPHVFTVSLQDATGALTHIHAIAQHQACQLAAGGCGLALVLYPALRVLTQRSEAHPRCMRTWRKPSSYSLP